MGIFDKLFGGQTETKTEKELPWIFLTSVNQFETIKKNSFHKPQVLFKHSTRCGISSMVMNKFVKNYAFDSTEADLFYLDLLSYRDVSDEVGFQFQVLHQSPQMIVIKNGEAVHHASHYDINTTRISDFI